MKTTAKLISVILTLSLLSLALLSCTGSTPSENQTESTSSAPETAPETELTIEGPLPSNKYREHVLMSDPFGREFYADEPVDDTYLSEVLYTLAGKPDFSNDEYLAFYERIYGATESALTRSDATEADVAREWAFTHGVVLTTDTRGTGPLPRQRVHYKWSEFIDSAHECAMIDYEENNRKYAVTAMFFCAEEMGLDIFERADIGHYKDADRLTVRIDKLSGKIGDVKFSTYMNRWPDREDAAELRSGSAETIWGWAEACSLIVWSEDDYIDPTKEITRGELAAMVEAFMEHYGIER